VLSDRSAFAADQYVLPAAPGSKFFDLIGDRGSRLARRFFFWHAAASRFFEEQLPVWINGKHFLWHSWKRAGGFCWRTMRVGGLINHGDRMPSSEGVKAARHYLESLPACREPLLEAKSVNMRTRRITVSFSTSIEAGNSWIVGGDRSWFRHGRWLENARQNWCWADSRRSFLCPVDVQITSRFQSTHPEDSCKPPLKREVSVRTASSQDLTTTDLRMFLRAF
jgi:hypothetical protein